MIKLKSLNIFDLITQIKHKKNLLLTLALLHCFSLSAQTQTLANHFGFFKVSDSVNSPTGLYHHYENKIFHKDHEFNYAHDLRRSEGSFAQYFYPQRINSRNLLNLFMRSNETSQDDAKLTSREDTYSEAIISHLSYRFYDEDTIFEIGRFPIKLGEGLSYNPINPVAEAPGQFIFTSGVQTQDGLRYVFGKSSDYEQEIIYLGHRNFTEDHHRIARSLLFIGKVRINGQHKITYLLSEDLKRYKYGLEYIFMMDQFQFFAQAVRHSQRFDTDDEDDQGLYNFITGVDFFELTPGFNLRIEGGKRDLNGLRSNEVTFIDALSFENFGSIFMNYSFDDSLNWELFMSYDLAHGEAFMRNTLDWEFYSQHHLKFLVQSYLSEQTELRENNTFTGVNYVFSF